MEKIEYFENIVVKIISVKGWDARDLVMTVELYYTVIINTDRECIVTFYSAVNNNNYYEAITKPRTTHI